MPTTLKSQLGPETVRRIAEAISAAWPAFPSAAFRADATRGLARLELLARGDHVARALRRHLPPDLPHALEVLVRSLGPDLPEEGLEEAGAAPFLYLPYSAFVRTYGLAAFEASMDAQHALTRRFTAEWSIRPFLESAPERTLAVLASWAHYSSPHVRRLVSEGTRPRLPWAPRLRSLVADPAPGLALIELLRDDPSAYVRRSVANHLNDVGKDHPALLLDTARRWLRGASEERRRLVTHALRSLARAGHSEALALLGHGGHPRIAVREVSIAPRRVRIGESVRVEVTLASRAREIQSLAVLLAVHYVKERGEARPKRFRLRTIRLPAGGEVRVGRTLSLAQLSTRRHHPGLHRLDLVVNGVTFPAGGFEVVSGSPRAARAAPPRRRGRAPPARRPR